ncbi:hypothetical protein BH11ACT1_BH11ACT1_23020 [soil metagenome]
MRIAWCTPFTPMSAIGEFSSLVVTALRELADVDVDIWYPRGTGGRSVPDRGRELVGSWQEALKEYDRVVYQIGDHATYHGQLVRAAAAVPGVVVMHDVSLTHLFFPTVTAMGPGEVRALFARISPELGDEAATAFLADPSSWAWEAKSTTTFPLSELAMENATAVVTHSHFAADQLRDRYVGDVSVLPLPVLHAPDTDRQPVRLPIDLTRPLVLQAGTMNENKCIEVVIEAFARSTASATAQLVVCGHGPEETVDRLKRLARRLTGDADIIVLGAVTDDVLHALRTQAAISTVLRYPSSEASSAVLIDSMAYGNAIVVADAGHYGEMPAGTVSTVPAPPTVDDVAAVLDTLLADPDGASAMGARASAYVADEHTAQNYARQILPILRGAGAAGPRRRLARELGTVLHQLGFLPDSPIVSQLASTTVELFGSAPRRPAVLAAPRTRARRAPVEWPERSPRTS